MYEEARALRLCAGQSSTAESVRCANNTVTSRADCTWLRVAASTNPAFAWQAWKSPWMIWAADTLRPTLPCIAIIACRRKNHMIDNKAAVCTSQGRNAHILPSVSSAPSGHYASACDGNCFNTLSAGIASTHSLRLSVVITMLFSASIGAHSGFF